MELQSIAFELGLERLHTETTFVKDETLKRHCQQFNQDLEEEKIFEPTRPAYAIEMEHSITTIRRASLPSGSNLFQQAMQEYERILREEEEKKARLGHLEEDNAEDNDVVDSARNPKVNSESAGDKTHSNRKTSLVYPPKKQPVLRRLYSVQIDRFSIKGQNSERPKRH
jgi:hypothetical protein